MNRLIVEIFEITRVRFLVLCTSRAFQLAETPVAGAATTSPDGDEVFFFVFLAEDVTAVTGATMEFVVVVVVGVVISFPVTPVVTVADSRSA